MQVEVEVWYQQVVPKKINLSQVYLVEIKLHSQRLLDSKYLLIVEIFFVFVLVVVAPSMYTSSTTHYAHVLLHVLLLLLLLLLLAQTRQLVRILI